MRCDVRALYEHSSGTIAEIDDQTLFLSVGGDVREEDVEPFFEVFGPLVASRAPTRILVDATYLGETPLRLRWQLVRRMRGLRSRVARTAIFGLPPRIETVLWVLLALGRREDIRSFLWRHEAESWVRGA